LQIESNKKERLKPLFFVSFYPNLPSWVALEESILIKTKRSKVKDHREDPP
jgi:hypothetical protein